MKNIYRLTLILAIMLIGTVLQADAQTLRTRDNEDDGPRPEEGNISGNHQDIVDLLEQGLPDDFHVNSNGEDIDHEEGEDQTAVQRGVQLQNLNIGIFPNPASSYLIVQFPESIEVQISLINILGRTVKQTQGDARNYRLELSEIPTGVYFIHIQSGDDHISKKIKIVH